eukprot:CAMPEP_0198214832 /NCGR_PEP_ID=MMETSP1445-20131203/44457_1 /TAXON_ID=36898 /ORGANISM="Pyramimonas sp., Strain CCMP2087" /LENGTH=308 /DNA_ID=CAMNT_0043890187 /DNA_START=678 /DNA_END=1605 /DNA_ORIENTATION=+
MYAKFKAALSSSIDAEAEPSPSEADLSPLHIPMHHASDGVASDDKPEHPRHSTTSRLPLLSSLQSPSSNVAGQPRKVNLKDKLRLLEGPSCRASSPEDSTPEDARADPHPNSKADQAIEGVQQELVDEQRAGSEEQVTEGFQRGAEPVRVEKADRVTDIPIPMHHASGCNTAQPGRPRQPTTARLLPLSSQQPPGSNVIGEPRIVSLKEMKEKMRLLDFPSCRASPPEGSHAEEARADPHPISKPDQVTKTFQPGAPSTSAEDILAEMMGDLPLKDGPTPPLQQQVQIRAVVFTQAGASHSFALLLIS